MGDGHYTTKEAAEILGISQRTVRRKIKNGELIGEKISGPYGTQYVLPQDQEAFNSKAEAITEVVPVNRVLQVDEIRRVIEEADRKKISEFRKIVEDVVEKENRELRSEITHLQEKIDNMIQDHEENHDSTSLLQKVRNWLGW